MDKIRIILAEDHIPFRTTIRNYLNRSPDIEIINESGCGEDILSLVNNENPDVLVLDLEFCGPLDGLEISNRLRQLESKTKILIIGTYNEPSYVESVLEEGVDGYLLKEEIIHQLEDAIRAVARGARGWFIGGTLLANPDLSQPDQE